MPANNYLHTIEQDKYRPIHQSFLHAFINNNDYIDFAMSSVYKGGNKRNHYKGTNGFIWENTPEATTCVCSKETALTYIREQIKDHLLMIADAYEGMVASADSPVYVVNYLDIITALNHSSDLWNIYVFDESMQWFVAITDENIGTSEETLCFIGKALELWNE